MKQHMPGKRMILSTMTRHSRTYRSESNKLWLQLTVPSNKAGLRVSIHAFGYQLIMRLAVISHLSDGKGVRI